MTAQGATPGPAPGRRQGTGRGAGGGRPSCNSLGLGPGREPGSLRWRQTAPDRRSRGVDPTVGGSLRFPADPQEHIPRLREPVVTRPQPSPCLQPVTVSRGRNKHRHTT